MENPILSMLENPFFVKYGLIGLFLNGMLSSVIPIPTELTSSALILAGEDKIAVFVVLTIGSIIGGLLAYYIGYSGSKLFKKLHVSPKKERADRVVKLLARYGLIMIFFAPWIPIFGDVITIIAGSTKYDMGRFIVAMTTGKTLKAAAIVYVSSWILPMIFH